MDARSSAATKADSFPVLVIDDNEADRTLMAMELGEAWPFSRDMLVDEAGDGEEAIRKLRARRFALVVLDWKMPGLGGAEVLRHIRQQGFRIPVVVVSGLEREDIDDDLESLSAAFLSKTQLTPENLHGAIATSLRLLGLNRPAPETSPG
jgi:CheY-like chemotaxis protein